MSRNNNWSRNRKQKSRRNSKGNNINKRQNRMHDKARFYKFCQRVSIESGKHTQSHSHTHSHTPLTHTHTCLNSQAWTALHICRHTPWPIVLERKRIWSQARRVLPRGRCGGCCRWLLYCSNSDLSKSMRQHMVDFNFLAQTTQRNDNGNDNIDNAAATRTSTHTRKHTLACCVRPWLQIRLAYFL